MTQSKNQSILYLDVNNLYGYAMSKFPTSGFKWIDPKTLDLNEHTRNSSKVCVLEVDLEYPKKTTRITQLLSFSSRQNRNQKRSAVWVSTKDYFEYPKELHNYYPLAPDKIEIKREMQSEYQLKITDVYNIAIGNNKVSNIFHEEKYVFHYQNFQLFLRLGLKLKKIHKEKDRKALYKLMKNAIYRKIMGSLRNRITSGQWKRLFKMYIKAKLYVAQNIWQ